MNLISKYNIQIPRYTSYPTVPAWKNNLNANNWKTLVKERFSLVNAKQGMSLYLHLPYCESLCTYCACNTRITVNHKVELPYIESLLAEWKLYLALFDEKPKLRELHLGGGTPTFFSPENLNFLLSEILSTCEIPSEHDFSFEGHPSNTTAEHLQTLYNLGFRRVSFGIQDFDATVQDVINRYQSVEEVRNVVELARNIGYKSINFDLVYGLPFQTAASMQETLQEVIHLKPDRIAFYSYAHVPWLKPGQRKFTEKDLPVDAVKRGLYEMGLKVFSQQGYVDIGMDHFALPTDSLNTAMHEGRMHRNFMGYTDMTTGLLLALGCSSISDCGTAFAQNIKTVEEYRAKIAEGEFAISKGHVLTTEDQLLQQLILDIMCKNTCSWKNTAIENNFLKKAQEQLQVLAEDNLIELHDDSLLVTAAGKGFLRNIAACFDRYLQQQPGKNIFSTVA